MKVLRLAMAAVVGLAAVVVSVSPASAWSSLGCRFSTGTLKWQDSTTTSSYSGAANNAVNAWNSTSTQFNLNKTTSGANVRVSNGNFGATWKGLKFVGITLDTSQNDPTVYSCSGGTWDTTIVTWWNTYYTDNYGAAKRQAIMVHEIGHALGLGHVDYENCSSIMEDDIDYWFDVCGYWAPRQDDINGANALY